MPEKQDQPMFLSNDLISIIQTITDQILAGNYQYFDFWCTRVNNGTAFPSAISDKIRAIIQQPLSSPEKYNKAYFNEYCCIVYSTGGLAGDYNIEALTHLFKQGHGRCYSFWGPESLDFHSNLHKEKPEMDSEAAKEAGIAFFSFVEHWSNNKHPQVMCLQGVRTENAALTQAASDLGSAHAAGQVLFQRTHDYFGAPPDNSVAFEHCLLAVQRGFSLPLHNITDELNTYIENDPDRKKRFQQALNRAIEAGDATVIQQAGIKACHEEDPPTILDGILTLDAVYTYYPNPEALAEPRELMQAKLDTLRTNQPNELFPSLLYMLLTNNLSPGLEMTSFLHTHLRDKLVQSLTSCPSFAHFQSCWADVIDFKNPHYAYHFREAFQHFNSHIPMLKSFLEPSHSITKALDPDSDSHKQVRGHIDQLKLERKLFVMLACLNDKARQVPADAFFHILRHLQPLPRPIKSAPEDLTKTRYRFILADSAKQKQLLVGHTEKVESEMASAPSP